MFEEKNYFSLLLSSFRVHLLKSKFDYRSIEHQQSKQIFSSHVVLRMGQRASSTADTGSSIQRSIVVNTRNTQPPILLNVFLDSLDVGDLLFLSGANLKSRVMSFGTWCEWTHVAMVDTCPTTGRRFVWESQDGIDECIDVLTQSAQKTGPRLIYLPERLQLYARDSGVVAPSEYGTGCRTLDVAMKKLWFLDHEEKNVWVSAQQTRQEFLSRLNRFQTSENWKSFEKSKFAMLRAQYGDFLGKNPQDTSQYFCSELVVETYKYAGALPSTTPIVNCSDHTPASLCNGTRLLPFQPGFRLSQELYEYRILLPPVPPRVATSVMAMQQ